MSKAKLLVKAGNGCRQPCNETSSGGEKDIDRETARAESRFLRDLKGLKAEQTVDYSTVTQLKLNIPAM